MRVRVRAGTWEEKKMDEWFKDELEAQLQAVVHVGADGLEASVSRVESFTGECTICKRRNKTSWIYDCSFNVKCQVGDEKVTLKIADMDNTDEEDYEIEVKWGKTSKRRAELENLVKPRGARGSDGLVPRVREAIALVVDTYMQQ
eukprot:TRINITY_DN8951_c0_g2_i1.p1 TRINITY_DN8951_c0_g2~~TRINITY_DN8951_c0_g2_i1.p1  ORF type:complete len:145 (+),score=30.51 TRINITY_DN8951_c0_g2_i1:99-533(+)